MGKVEIDVVKPNLHVYNEAPRDRESFEIAYSLRDNIGDSIESISFIDSIVKTHLDRIGLKIKKSDFDTMKLGKGEGARDEEYSVPLEELINVFRTGEAISTIGSDNQRLFGVDKYIIDSSNIRDHKDFRCWIALERELKDPNETINQWEKINPLIRFDREKTIENMRKIYEKVNSEVPNYDVCFDLLGTPSLLNFKGNYQCGFIGIVSLREGGEKVLESVKKEFVDGLKEFDGPCLSYDARNIYCQFYRLAEDVNTLANRYGDILVNPIWTEKFFRIDP